LGRHLQKDRWHASDPLALLAGTSGTDVAELSDRQRHNERIDERLAELDREWDIERDS
jgi:hypothetical protein